MKHTLKKRQKTCPRCKRRKCRRNDDGEFIICEVCEKRAKVKKQAAIKTYLHDSIETAMAESGIPLRHKDAAISQIKLDLKDITSSMFFIGEKGLGKTFSMVALAKELISEGHQVKYITVPELIMEIKSSFNDPKVTEQEVINRYTSVPFLFLDDIGVEKPSDWVMQVMFILIDRRYMDNLHICVSTNLSLDDLSERQDARIVSRLVEMCEVYEFEGDDRRLTK